MKKKLTVLLLVFQICTFFCGCEARNNAYDSSNVIPKHIFLFIGDGMSYPQIQAAADYLGVLNDADYMQAQPSLKEYNGAVLDGPEYLNFMNFEVAGTAVTYDSNSFAPDSAAAATAMASGHKTYSRSININEEKTETFQTIAEKVHEQLGMRVGIVTSVNLNHATPAAFYAHQENRNNYYEIGKELIQSEFEYFAGGALLKPDGHDTKVPSPNLYELAEAAGYRVVKTQAEAETIDQKSKQVILITEYQADSNAMNYELDRTKEMWSLADYVSKGIEVLENEKGFFLMCEGGKIDWAYQANDAASGIHDTIALADAVQVAIDFAKEHKGETLILVTGDHETGGMSIGFAGSGQDTYLSLLENQKISFVKFKNEYVTRYQEKDTSFEEVMKDVETWFGLKMTGEETDRMLLTENEILRLKNAYEKSVHGVIGINGEAGDKALYGSNDPLTVTITQILANKAGISFATFAHTGLPVAVFAEGTGAKKFSGYYDNTEIYHRLAELLEVSN